MRKHPSRSLLRQAPAHFALYRAYLEGLDEATLHARHRRGAPAALKPGSLPRDAHAGAAAGRAVGKVPTLEAFREAVDPDAFYSDRELVALYVET